MNQLKKILANLSIAQRISIVAVALAVGGGLYALAHWKKESDFHPLYTGMAAQDAASVVQKLRESGVEYRLAESGGTVMVPSARMNEVRLELAAAGLPKSGRLGFEIFDKTNFGATDFVEHVNFRRALEGELERSVMSLAEVEQARVHITFSKDSVFLDARQPAKASVMLRLKPGTTLSPQNVIAVSHLVASAVEGLTPDAVSVLDMNGNLLSHNRPKRSDGSADLSDEMLQFRQGIEKDLLNKINVTLEPLLGPEHFRTGISVDCDLTSGEQSEETFDPNKSVMLSSQKSEDTTNTAGASGVPGTASSLPRPTSKPTTSLAGLSRRTENVTYQSSRVVKHTRTPQGVIKRVSLAVLVDNTVRWEGQGAARHRVLVPLPPETIKGIHDLIAGVAGISTERGDQVIVESLPFESTVNAEPMPTAPTPPAAGAPAPGSPEFLKRYRNLIAIGVAAVLLVLFFVWRVLAANRRKEEDEPVMRRELGAAATDGNIPLAGAEGQEEVAGQIERAAPPLAELPLPESDRVDALVQIIIQTVSKDARLPANILTSWVNEGG